MPEQADEYPGRAVDPVDAVSGASGVFLSAGSGNGDEEAPEAVGVMPAPVRDNLAMGANPAVQPAAPGPPAPAPQVMHPRDQIKPLVRYADGLVCKCTARMVRDAVI